MEEQKLEKKFRTNREELSRLLSTMSRDITAGKMTIGDEQVMLPEGESKMDIEFETHKNTGKLEMKIKWSS